MCNFNLCTLLFSVIKQLPEESVGFVSYIDVIFQRESLELVLCRGFVFHYECYFVYPLFPYHEHFFKGIVLMFYYEDTVGVYYK